MYVLLFVKNETLFGTFFKLKFRLEFNSYILANIIQICSYFSFIFTVKVLWRKSFRLKR